MQILLFDIDGTLFNSSRFRRLLLSRLSMDWGIDEKTLEKDIKGYYSTLETGTDFYPDSFLNFFYRKYKKAKKLNGFLWNDKKLYEECLFPDVEESLKKLSKVIVLGIFSQGFNDFQINKLGKTGILKYFNDRYILIEHRKLSAGSLAKIPGNSVIIDNKERIAETLRGRYQVIWINRLTEYRSKEFQTILSLKELTGLVLQ